MSSARRDAPRAPAAAMPKRQGLGRLGARDWRDVERACKLGKKHGAYSVEAHGVRVVFRMGAHNPSQETKEGERLASPAHRPRVETTSEQEPSQPKAPNSAQRRSAARLLKYITQYKGSGTAQSHAASTTAAPSPREPAPVDSDVRADDATMAEAAGDGRGRKRGPDEASGSTSITTAHPAPAGAAGHRRVDDGPVRGRTGPEAGRPTPAESRRERAESALETRRAART